MEQGEIVLYKALDSAEFQIEVRVEDESRVLGIVDSITNVRTF